MTPTSTAPRPFQRIYVRIPHSVPVWVLSRTPGEPLLDSVISTAICANLSLGGACIYCHRQLHATHIAARFCAPNLMFITKPCRIVRCTLVAEDLWEYGVEFDEPLPTQVMTCFDQEFRERTGVATGFVSTISMREGTQFDPANA